jgi:hypothetical protein
MVCSLLLVSSAVALEQQQLQERCLLPRLCFVTTRYVQVLLSPTSRVVAEGNAVVATAAMKINHQIFQL